MAPHLGIGQYLTSRLNSNNAALASLGVTLEQLKDGVIDLGGNWKPGEPKFETPAASWNSFPRMRDLNLQAVPRS